jgi:hypothetical protein
MGKKVIIVYKGLTGEAERSPDDNSYQGVILDTPQEVSFGGSTISELQLSFTRAVDAYRGETGNRSIRIGAESGAGIASEAAQG